jgi:hypothetical protein
MAPNDASGAVTVTAVDYAFENLPSTVTAGTVLSLTNDSTKEIHELVAVRLPDGETRPAAELMALPQGELQGLLYQAPPALVLVAPPGNAPQITIMGDGTLAQPGRYLVICTIPTGADPAVYLEAAQSGTGPPQVAGGPPHFVNGMYGEITVT